MSHQDERTLKEWFRQYGPPHIDVPSVRFDWDRWNQETTHRPIHGENPGRQVWVGVAALTAAIMIAIPAWTLTHRPSAPSGVPSATGRQSGKNRSPSVPTPAPGLLALKPVLELRVDSQLPPGRYRLSVGQLVKSGAGDWQFAGSCGGPPAPGQVNTACRIITGGRLHTDLGPSPQLSLPSASVALYNQSTNLLLGLWPYGSNGWVRIQVLSGRVTLAGHLPPGRYRIQEGRWSDQYPGALWRWEAQGTSVPVTVSSQAAWHVSLPASSGLMQRPTGTLLDGIAIIRLPSLRMVAILSPRYPLNLSPVGTSK